MAGLGSHIEEVGAKLGASNQQVVDLTGLAALGGESVDELATAMERFSLNVQKSTKDGTNPAAAALKALNLNARDLIGVPVTEYFGKLSDAVSKFNPSLNLTNAVMTLSGRSIANLLPTLLQGREHVDEFMQAWDRASEGLAGAVPGMADTHEKLLLLQQSTESLGARIFSTLKPAIDSVITSITGWVESLDTDRIRTAVADIGEVTISVIENIAEFFVQATAEVDKFIAKLGQLDLVRVGLNILDPNLGDLILGKDQNLDKQLADIQSKMDTGLAAVRESAAKYREAFASAVPKPGTGGAMGAEVIGIQQQALAAMEAYQRKNIGGINFGAGDAGKAAMEAAQGQIKAAELAYQGTAEKLKSTFDLHKITEGQKTAATVAAINVREDAELKALNDEQQQGGLTVAERQKIEDQKTQIVMKAINDRQKAQDEGLKEDTKEWQTALAPIESAWNSQLRSLLSGTETFSAAMKKVFGDLVLDAIEQFEKLAVEKAAAGLAGSVGGTGTGGGLLGGIGSLVGSLFGGGGQSAALATAGTTLTTAGTSLNASAAALSGAAATLTGSAGAGAAGGAVSGAASGAGGGLFGDILGKVGGLIGDMVIPGFATGAWEIPSAAGGMWTVGGGGSLAVLHPRETVLPSAAATGFRAMAEGRMPGQGGDNAAMAGHMARQTRTMQDIHEALTSNTASQRRSNSSLESSVDQLRRALIRR
jgi:hypothetical protein